MYRFTPPIFLLLLLLLITLSTVLLTACQSTHQDDQVREEEEEEDTPITRFQQYLRINTAHPTPDYASAVSYLTSQAHSIGLTARTLHLTPSKPLLLLTWAGTQPSLPSLLLNSHLDSVPAEPSKWSHPPFSASLTPDGRIHARGAQDDKSISMQYLEAIRTLRKSTLPNPIRTVHISYVPDEEIGGADGWGRFVQSEAFDELRVGFVLDEGQASVGDELRVFYADRCPWWVIVRAVGAPGHGSRMYDGSAVENLMRSVEVVGKFREAQFDAVKAGLAAPSEVVSVNPVYFKAGIQSGEGFVMNMQPSEAEAGFDLRLPPTADPDLLKRRILEEWAPAHWNLTCTISERGPIRDFKGRPIMTATNDSNPWWSVFSNAIAAAGGKLAKPEILASTTDARFLRQRGIPTLGFSPMTNTPILFHDHNEFLKDTVYLRGIEIYEHIISALSSFKGSST